MSEQEADRRTLVLVGYAALAAVCAAVYLLRLDRVCGLFSDDGWYVLLGKALATGQGYSAINAPTPGAVPVYPPGFPLILSLVFRVFPSFPANVPLLKAVSIAAMAGVALLTRAHCERDQRLGAGLAWAIAAATALHPAFVFLATSTVMSECVFTLVQLAAVVEIEGAVRGERPVGRALLGGGLAAFAFLTRSLGIALVVAGLLRLVGCRRWRPVLAFVLGAAVVAGPWLLYARAHAPTPAEQAEENDGVMYGYATHFWLRIAGHAGYGTATLADLPDRVRGEATAVARSAMGALHVYFPFRSIEPAAWGRAPLWAHGLAFAATALVLVGFLATVRRQVTTAELLVPLSLLVTVLWPFPVTRYVLPLLPFVLCYTARGIDVVIRHRLPALAPAAIGVLALVSLSTDVAYLDALRGPEAGRPRWNQIFDEELRMLDWVRANVPAEQVVATSDPALLHLFTGHRTVGVWDMSGEAWHRVGARVFADTAFLGFDPRLQLYPSLYRSESIPSIRVLDLGLLFHRDKRR